MLTINSRLGLKPRSIKLLAAKMLISLSVKCSLQKNGKHIINKISLKRREKFL